MIYHRLKNHQTYFLSESQCLLFTHKMHFAKVPHPCFGYKMISFSSFICRHWVNLKFINSFVEYSLFFRFFSAGSSSAVPFWSTASEAKGNENLYLFTPTKTFAQLLDAHCMQPVLDSCQLPT